MDPVILPQEHGAVTVETKQNENVAHLANIIVTHPDQPALNVQLETSGTYGRPYGFHFPPGFADDIFVGGVKIWPAP